MMMMMMMMMMLMLMNQEHWSMAIRSVHLPSSSSTYYRHGSIIRNHTVTNC